MSYKKMLMLILLFSFLYSKTFGDGKITEGGSQAKLVKSRNGISLYERWIEISGNVQAREILLEFAVNAPLSEAINLIKDPALNIKWNKNVKACELFDAKEDHWIMYIKYGIPWPFDDQDCLLESQAILKKSDYCLIEFKSVVHDAYPVYDKVERMQDVKGKWELKHINGKTFIKYTIRTFPSKVPHWVTDPVVRNSFLSSMHEFVMLLEK